MRIHYKLLTALFIVVVTHSNCKKILDLEPVGTNTVEHFITTTEGINSLLNGMYSPLAGLYGQPMLRITDMASDDGWTWRNETETDFFITLPTFSYTSAAWQAYYRMINYANNILDNIQNVTDFPSEAVKNSIKGQALFMRAYSYFNLVRIFGGVPLITKQVTGRKDAEKPRASIQDVYTLIKADLADAITFLPTTYPGTAGMEKGRPTTYAASTLKGYVHLELEEWDQAIAAVSPVIGKGTLLTNYADNFNGKAENGTGSLFEVQYNVTLAAPQRGIFAPETDNGLTLILPTDNSFAGGGGGVSTGGGFVQDFETGDARKNVILSSYNLANFLDATKPVGSLLYVNKYYNKTDPASQSTWNYPLLRYADALLIKAEALNERGYVADGEAFDLLHLVRQVAALNKLTATDLPDQATFRNSLRHERRIEFAFECKRYFDLNRWGVLQTVIQNQLNYQNKNFPANRLMNHPITGKKYHLYPIPETEFTNNAQLGKQNPGY